MEEIKKIRWCDLKTLKNTTLSVLFIMLFSVGFFLLCDLGISALIKIL